MLAIIFMLYLCIACLIYDPNYDPNYYPNYYPNHSICSRKKK